MNVVVGVRPSLPVGGVAILLGNDLASGKGLPSPIVSPVSSGLYDLMSMDFPEVFFPIQQCYTRHGAAR